VKTEGLERPEMNGQRECGRLLTRVIGWLGPLQHLDHVRAGSSMILGAALTVRCPGFDAVAPMPPARCFP
jgi:hypothetical protein